MIAIVSEDEVGVWRDAQMRILDQAAHLHAPVRIDRRIVCGVARELVAVCVPVGALEDVVRLRARGVVDDRDAVLQLRLHRRARR